ncbi:MAG: ribonuclease P protein subunit [Candidatus Methanomethylicia archaeon]|nr:ribonuclease P protein subunit [Candidatus Methanomethylicia archaeon]MCX8168949.1 ribonuclease P protein subunit [Candidatus Methanomethylicia archaeon]MDW7988681.1 ribonuclease P protein subunit [Nitrososphaerota archaeon]
MTITAKNIIMHELIGLKVKVSECRNPSCIGIEGIVVDETMKTIKIKDKRDCRIKVIPKMNTKFIFETEIGELVEVDGNVILARPEDRLKRIPKRRWW